MSRSRNLVAGIGAVVIGAATFAVTALAQSERKPILHEDLMPPQDEAQRTAQKLRSRQGVFGSTPAEGQNPSAIGAGSKILPEPVPDPIPAGKEPVHGTEGFAADRYTDYRPDRHTTEDSTLHYVEVFNPSVVPFKRMTAFDAVRDDYTLYSASQSLADLVVGSEPPGPDDDLFWGSLVISLTTGEDIAIPSVSPEMRILSYEVSPRVAVTFSKDGADNFFVRTDEPGLDKSERRLVFLVAADARYFAPVIPKGVRVRDIEHPVRPLPRPVREVADRVLRRMRLHPGLDLEEALQKLVYYFRSFEAKASPPTSGDIYWDLFETQAGVCRHRSFAFMVTANALGIPARFVANEAHAWVEVWLPGSRWSRVDLGGAASTLEVNNAADKTVHRPRDNDPFAQPPNYADNYTQLEGDIRGLSRDQISEAREQPAATTEGGKGTGFFDSAEAEGPPDPGHMTGPGKRLPEIPPEELEGKKPTSIAITSANAKAFRGETITLTGAVLEDDAGTGVPGQRVDIFLAPKGQEGEDALVVGHTVTAADGRWTAVVNVPRDIELRDYEVFASTPGDKTYQPTLSE